MPQKTFTESPAAEAKSYLTEQTVEVSAEALAVAIAKYKLILGNPRQYDGKIYDPDVPGWAYDFLGFDVCNLIVGLQAAQAEVERLRTSQAGQQV
jgi:hypothetical protein